MRQREGRRREGLRGERRASPRDERLRLRRGNLAARWHRLQRRKRGAREGIRGFYMSGLDGHLVREITAGE
jgi:hypothetical protein